MPKPGTALLRAASRSTPWPSIREAYARSVDDEAIRAMIASLPPAAIDTPPGMVAILESTLDAAVDLAQVADWVQRKGGEPAVATPPPSEGSGAGRVVQLRSRHPYFIVPKAALKPLKSRS